MTTQRDPDFERLLGYIRDNRAFDFTGYKRPSLVRRVEKRMQKLELEDYAEYRMHLERNPDPAALHDG